MLFNFLIKVFKALRYSAVLILKGIAFQILGSQELKLLVPNVTWFVLEIFSLTYIYPGRLGYFSSFQFFFFMKSGFKLLIVLYILVYYHNIIILIAATSCWIFQTFLAVVHMSFHSHL